MKNEKLVVSRCGEYHNNYKQSFSDDMLEYKLVDGKPTVVGKKSLTEFLNSNKECALDAILDKYSKAGILEGSGVFSSNRIDFIQDNDQVVDGFDNDPLLASAEAINELNSLRVKYGLPDTMSYKEIVSAIINKSNDYSRSFDQKIKEVENEKKNIDKTSISKELQENSVKNASKESSGEI